MDTAQFDYEVSHYTNNVTEEVVRLVGMEAVANLTHKVLQAFEDACTDGYLEMRSSASVAKAFVVKHILVNTIREARLSRRAAWESTRA